MLSRTSKLICNLYFCCCFNFTNGYRRVNVCKKMFGEAYNISHNLQDRCIAKFKADEASEDQLSFVECDIGEIERRRAQFITMSEGLGHCCENNCLRKSFRDQEAALCSVEECRRIVHGLRNKEKLEFCFNYVNHNVKEIGKILRVNWTLMDTVSHK